LYELWYIYRENHVSYQVFSESVKLCGDMLHKVSRLESRYRMLLFSYTRYRA